MIIPRSWTIWLVGFLIILIYTIITKNTFIYTWYSGITASVVLVYALWYRFKDIKF